MSAKHPTVVYLGELEAGRRLSAAARRLDWGVYLPAEAFEALGNVVLFSPDVVVIDHTARPTVAAEVYHHLRTLTSGCPPIISVTREAVSAGWADSGRYALPPTAEPSHLIAAVRKVVERGESISE